jgi:3-hydroxymyristoyl/3-hydroxydecanoyl-(acyl carrier protein) dehydratase
MSQWIDADHPSIPGHFPGNPLVPGVVILERVIEHVLAEHPGRQISGLPQVKFLAPIQPEQPFEIHSTPGSGERVNFLCKSGDARLVEGCLQLQSM